MNFSIFQKEFFDFFYEISNFYQFSNFFYDLFFEISNFYQFANFFLRFLFYEFSNFYQFFIFFTIFTIFTYTPPKKLPNAQQSCVSFAFLFASLRLSRGV